MRGRGQLARMDPIWKHADTNASAGWGALVVCAREPCNSAKRGYIKIKVAAVAPEIILLSPTFCGGAAELEATPPLRVAIYSLLN